MKYIARAGKKGPKIEDLKKGARPLPVLRREIAAWNDCLPRLRSPASTGAAATTEEEEEAA